MFKVKEEITKENYAKIILEPLEDGLGHTLGNSLRRVLLTSLLGSAVTSVKIDGVAHQFSTIEGISEDVIEIILNIKKIRININSDKSIKLTIKAAGKGIVKAGDLKIEGDGEVSNKDQVIATLNDSKAKLNMELIAEKGKGYSMAEDRKNSEIGVIAIDALFSPVVACNYTVDPTRVGRKTNFDKLTLEISTDGTITPFVALNEAAKLLSTTFLKIYEPDQEEELEISTAISDEVLKMTVEELDLPVRITNALRAIEVNTIENLIFPAQSFSRPKT